MIQRKEASVGVVLTWGTVIACAIPIAGCGGSSGPNAPATAYKVGVNVSGLSGSGLILQLNGGNDLAVTMNGVATFTGSLAPGAAYAIVVHAQPTFPAQTCFVTNGSGTIGTADVNSVAVTCSTSITTLYSFTGATQGTGSSDGASPNGSLVQGPDGALYGTTNSGGMPGPFGHGIVFKITLEGQETLLHSFGVIDGDGSAPVTGLVLGSDGNFYGATPYSTHMITPTVYQINAAGAESVIEPFSAFVGLDDYPMLGNLIQGNDGLLYGADFEFVADADDRYRIFGITTAGARVLTGDIGPNLSPHTNLWQGSDGGIYGTTDQAGAYGMGSVFEVEPDSKTIYSFGSFSGDALAPQSPMIQGSDGTFYGTTATGGSPSSTCPKGCGTVFKVTRSGTETVLYSFGRSPGDGQGPSGALLQASDGNFYGVTAAGGSTANGASTNSSCASANAQSGYSGCGTIYKITPQGVATVLYSFGSVAGDGTAPSGALLQAGDGNLYGTTVAGGVANDGTVFKLVSGAK